MTRTLCLAGFLAVLLLAFLALRKAGGTEAEQPLRGRASASAAELSAARPGDPVAQAVEELAAWPIAAAPAR